MKENSDQNKVIKVIAWGEPTVGDSNIWDTNSWCLALSYWVKMTELLTEHLTQKHLKKHYFLEKFINNTTIQYTDQCSGFTNIFHNQK